MSRFSGKNAIVTDEALMRAVRGGDVARLGVLFERYHRPLDAGEGTVLLLFRRGHTRPLQTDGGLVPGHDGSGPAHLAFAIDRDEAPGWELHFAALGVEVESRVTWARGGLSLYFRDPDGRSVELATPAPGRATRVRAYPHGAVNGFP